MCASLAGDPDSASAQIDDARRHGRIGDIDLALAEKVVGAGGGRRAATIEWDPVDSLTAWQFGLSVGTGMVPPDRLMNGGSLQMRAFEARAPLLSVQQRLSSAMIAAGLGVFSSQSLVDLYSALYDNTDPSDLPTTDAWQLREAFVGKDETTRVQAIRHLLDVGKSGLQREAARALVARAASLITPDAKLAKDAPDLISAMLAAGYDRSAVRSIPAVGRIDDNSADRCWAMLALAAPEAAEAGTGRLNAFVRRIPRPRKFEARFSLRGLPASGGSASILPIRSAVAMALGSGIRPVGQRRSTPPPLVGRPEQWWYSPARALKPRIGPRSRRSIYSTSLLHLRGRVRTSLRG